MDLRIFIIFFKIANLEKRSLFLHGRVLHFLWQLGRKFNRTQKYSQQIQENGRDFIRHLNLRNGHRWGGFIWSYWGRIEEQKT